MKIVKKIIRSTVTLTLVSGVILSLAACSDHSPLVPGTDDGEAVVTLAKKGGTPAAQSNKNDKSHSPGHNPYPISESKTYRFSENENHYNGGTLNLPNGSKFHLESGAITPPPGTSLGEDVTITMDADLDDTRNELVFTFGPHGCRFDPPARIRLKWKDLNIDVPKLYYIEEDGSYTEQQPDYLDISGQWMFIHVDHFSRYALGGE